MEVRDAVIVVTAAASGIGKALAERFAADGARGVVLADLDRDATEVAANGIEGSALAVQCDVSDPGAGGRPARSGDDEVRANRSVLCECGGRDRGGRWDPG